MSRTIQTRSSLRNASSAEKKKVYKTVLERATERQKRVLREAAAAK